MSAQFNDDSSKLSDLTDQYNLRWEGKPLEFFNGLTEEQAIEFSKALEQYLPQFQN